MEGMDWLKDWGPTGIMAGCLVYLIQWMTKRWENHLSNISTTLQNLVTVTSEMKAKVEDCPQRGRRDE